MEHTNKAGAAPAPKTRWDRQLYFWVLTAILIGVLLGWLAPTAGIAMEPIGTTFVNAMRMLIGPIVFLTIVGGIASVADLKKVGMTGLKALTYFQVGTICALVFGLVAINIFRLGEGVNATPSTIKTTDAAAKLIDAGAHQEWWQFLTNIIPTSIVQPFIAGDILQIIFIAVAFGIALNAMGKLGAPVLDGVQRLTGVMFKILGFIMKAAPLGAFGAMAFAVGKYGVSSLSSMGGLIALFYITSILFVVVVLGSVMAFLKLNIFNWASSPSCCLRPRVLPGSQAAASSLSLQRWPPSVPSRPPASCSSSASTSSCPNAAPS
ncbi:Na+/H+-dicarboxylate symporter [Arthrobacter sp. GAS37]|uniref:cation:dicarboxylate symporter family transporter n=1 Tax=Arthrobacter sp. GAS37 TaxID=3156261 RepID=UPI003835274B